VLVETLADTVVGVVTLQPLPMMHEDLLWGRISALVISEDCRGTGIGGALLREAERRGADLGMTRFEVTSGDQRTDAHRFYRTHGYAEPRACRFLKPCD
jgi:GNAT superfamily N-acetyltransferase